MIRHQVIRIPESNFSEISYEAPVLEISNFKLPATPSETPVTVATPVQEEVSASNDSENEPLQFVHLHVHTQYSVLQSTSDISGLIKKAKEWHVPAIAMTDHGNMMAAFQFVAAALKQEVKPIVGCELNICRDLTDKKNQDNGFQIPVLAKTKKGYHNLAKISSIAHTQGFYYVPRVDRNTILEFKEDLIILSGGVYGEVAYKILNEGEEKAEEAFVWWKENFGDDFYAEFKSSWFGRRRPREQSGTRFL